MLWGADIALSLFGSFLQRDGQRTVDSTIIQPSGLFCCCPKHFLDVVEENNARWALGDNEYALKSPKPLDDDGIRIDQKIGSECPVGGISLLPLDSDSPLDFLFGYTCPTFGHGATVPAALDVRNASVSGFRIDFDGGNVRDVVESSQSSHPPTPFKNGPQYPFHRVTASTSASLS